MGFFFVRKQRFSKLQQCLLDKIASEIGVRKYGNLPDNYFFSI